MDHPSASSRAEAFPAGLRVLVVDDDPTWLKILEKMLRKCSYEEVGPKKILDLMNVPGLTRENVASHLQKYRLYLSRLQKQNESRALGGNMQSDLRSKNPPGNVSQHSSIAHQSSIAMQQSAAPSGYVCTTQKIHAEGVIPDIHVDDIKSMVSLQVRDSMEALDSQKVNSVSQLGVLLSFKGMVPNAAHKSFEPSVSKHQPWSGGVPLMQFMQYPKHDHEPYSLLEDYSLPPQSNQQHLAAADHLRTPPPVISITRDTQKDKTGLSQIKPVFMDYRSSPIKTISPIACTIDSVSVQVERGILNTQDSGVAYENSAIQSIKDSYLNQTNNHILIPPSRELCLKGGEELALLPDDLSLCALQGIGCFDNGLNSMEIFQYNDSASLTEVHNNSYDGLEFNYEYMYDSVIDECLFA